MNKMLNNIKLAIAVFCTASTLSFTSANAVCCAPEVCRLVNFTAPYNILYDGLVDDLNENIPTLTLLLNNLYNNPTVVNYDALLQEAYNIINAFNGSTLLTAVTEPDTGNALLVTTPRIVITEPDGTVVLDTGLWTGVGPFFRVSTFDNWQDNWAGLDPAIVTNHNTRVAILDAQLWPCGIGAETKYSSTLSLFYPESQPFFQSYVAVRLGDYLNNAGTVRLSIDSGLPL